MTNTYTRRETETPEEFDRLIFRACELLRETGYIIMRIDADEQSACIIFYSTTDYIPAN